MIEKEYCELFLNKNVNIGTPHLYLDRLFFHTGKIVEIKESSLTLQKKDGIKNINFEDIEEIKLCKEEEY